MAQKKVEQGASVRRYLQRHATLVRGVLIAGVGLILVMVVVVPVIGRISELQDKIGSRRKEAESLSQKVTILSNLDQQILDERVKVLDQALPPRKDIVLYLATIEGLSRELELNFSGISLSPGDVTEASASAKTRRTDIIAGVHSLETELKIDGSQERIYEFLRLIENSLPLVQVKDVKVSNSGNEGRYTLSMRAGMLWASSDITKVSGAVTLFTDKEEEYFSQLETFRRFGTPTLLLENQTGSAGAVGKNDLFAPLEILQVESN